MSRSNDLFSLEVVTLGAQDDCERFFVEASIINIVTKKVAFKAGFIPRPITDTNNTDAMCLLIDQANFAMICRLNETNRMFEFIIEAKVVD